MYQTPFSVSRSPRMSLFMTTICRPILYITSHIRQSFYGNRCPCILCIARSPRMSPFMTAPCRPIRIAWPVYQAPFSVTRCPCILYITSHIRQPPSSVIRCPCILPFMTTICRPILYITSPMHQAPFSRTNHLFALLDFPVRRSCVGNIFPYIQLFSSSTHL